MKQETEREQRRSQGIRRGRGDVISEECQWFHCIHLQQSAYVSMWLSVHSIKVCTPAFLHMGQTWTNTVTCSVIY